MSTYLLEYFKFVVVVVVVLYKAPRDFFFPPMQGFKQISLLFTL